MDNIIECKLDSTCKEIYTGIWQHDYGQILRITGVDLPKAVEVQFSLRDKGGDTLTRIGTTVDGVTEVKVPDSFLKNENCMQNYLIYAWIYVTDDASGNTEYQIILHVKSRPKPEEPTEEPLPEPNIFHETVEAVNVSADRAAASEQNAKASATEASKYAASASESAVAAEKTKEDALKEVGEKKQEAIEAIQEQEEASVGKIIDHTDNEIQRIQNQAAGSKRELEQTIANAGYSKEELDESIQTAGDTKTALDKSTELAGTAKTELDTSTQKAGEAKTALDGSAKTAGEMQETLNATVRQAGALDTSLGEKIKTGTQLKTDLVASGEKAVQDIQTAGSEQLDKMQAVAEEFTADREQITTNKEDIGSLKEDLGNKITKFYASNQGENHLADSDDGKIQDMMIHGKSSQDGTPSVENPVEIKSVVNPTIKLTGSNILKMIDGEYQKNGVTITVSNGVIKIKGTSNGKFDFNLTENIDTFFKEGTEIIFSSNNVKGTEGKDNVYLDFSNNTTIGFSIMSANLNTPYIIKERDTKYSFNLWIRCSGAATIDETWKPQILIGKTITTFKPYTEQTITLPITLNAIPVSSGGNVTIDGQQYIADRVVEKDGVFGAERNIREIHTNTKTMNNSEEYPGWNKVEGISDVIYYNEQPVGASRALTFISNFTQSALCQNNIKPNNIMFLRWDIIGYSQSELIAKAIDVDMYVRLQDAIFEPLPGDMQAKLRTLVTNYPVTNISVTSDQLDGYTVFNYPISMANGWNYVKQQLGDTRDYIYDMDAKAQDIDIQSAEAYVNSEYAVALTELEV